MSDLIRVMPAIALRGTTILPDMIVHFDVSREKSVKAVEASMLQDQKIFLVTQRDPENENPGLLDVYKIGTIAVIKQVAKLPKGIVRVLVEGKERAELLSFENNSSFLEAEVVPFDKHDLIPVSENAKEAMLRSMKEIFAAYGNENQKISREIMAQILEMEDVERMVDQICIHIQIGYEPIWM